MEREQQTLDGVHAPPGKRKHFDAEFDKFYSVYVVDFQKYNALSKMLATKNFDKLSQYPDINYEDIYKLRKWDKDKIKPYCYVLDEDGKRQHLGDEKHIFRVNALKNLRQALVNYIDLLELLSFQQDLSTEIIRNYGEYTYYEERYTSENYWYGATRYKGQAFTTKDIELNWVRDADLKTQIKAYIAVLRICKKEKAITLDEAIKRVKSRFDRERKEYD